MGSQGTTTVNFGAFPGSSEASATVTGQASILAGSLVEAWVYPTATGDHTADEHIEEPIRVMAGNVVAGTGFTIYARCANQLPEPYPWAWQLGRDKRGGVDGGAAVGFTSDNVRKLYGTFTVAWVWN